MPVKLLTFGGVVLTGVSFFTLSGSKSDSEKPKQALKRSTKHQTSLIVGTGIIGLTSAYYLAKSGHRVICVERREDVGLETSYKNGSLICPSLLTPWANADVPKQFFRSFFDRSSRLTSTKIWPKTFFSFDFYRWLYHYLKNCTHKAQLINAKSLLTLSMFSRNCLDEIIADTSIEFSRSSIGSLQIAVDEKIYQQLKEEAEHIPNTKYLSDSDQVVAHEPILKVVKDRLYAGVFSSMDTNGNIHEFCDELKKYLINKYNVQFLFNTDVDQFIVQNIQNEPNKDRQRRIVGIQTKDDQNIENIDNVIVTNGNYIMPLMKKLNLFIPIYPVKGYVVEIKVPSTIALPKMNLVDDVNKLYISALKPKSDYGLVRVSGLAEFAGWDDIGILSEPARAQYLYEQTIHWLPHLAPYEKNFHSCSRPVSPDDVPLIGKCSKFDNLYVNCGHGSKGWTLAFGSAALLARIVNEVNTDETRNEINPELYSPNRFST